MTTNNYWSMTEGVFNCLIDKERSLAFGRAIASPVRQEFKIALACSAKATGCLSDQRTYKF
jgi:hypothetical protein